MSPPPTSAPEPTETDKSTLHTANAALLAYNASTPPGTYTLNLLGDIMLGRLIDQLFPIHVSNAEEASHIASLRSHYQSTAHSGTSSSPNNASVARSTAHLHQGNYGPLTPWSTTLPLLYAADLTLGNLETSATTTSKPWPDKVFNYRMHPSNLSALKAARIDYVSLANNHTLDFCEQGLRETVNFVREAGLKYAGASDGEGLKGREEAVAPAVLWLGGRRRVFGAVGHEGKEGEERQQAEGKESVAADGETEHEHEHEHEHEIHVYAASDHPSDWASVPTFHLIDYSTATRRRLKEILTSPSRPPPALKIFSIHWGPNYLWHPERERRELAHFLIDECGVDVVFGHSSHHVQGVEVYRGGLVVYGCGDFVDDYAVVEGFRNDLGAVWRVGVGEVCRGGNDGVGMGGGRSDGGGKGRKKLKVERLEVYPTVIDKFRTRLLDTREEDHGWVVTKVRELSRNLGTEAESHLGEEGQLVFRL